MSIKEKFIKDLISELNDANERQLDYENKRTIDVCYVVSVIDQQLEDCKEFLEDITKNAYHINGYDEDTSGGYTNGKIRILIEKPDSEKESNYMVDAYYDYCYYIEFTKDERSWGYCQCSSGDIGYNADHDCCGSGCDWTAPSFNIEKSICLGGGMWNGQAKDYWKYKDKFNLNEQNKNNEVEKFKLKQRKESLQNQIAELKIELEKLS